MPAPQDLNKRTLWIQRMSQARKGKPAWNKGRKMPLEFRHKMSLLALKFWHDPHFQEKVIERNRKIGLSRTGDKNPMKRLEVRQKASLSMMGRLKGELNPSRRPEVQKKISQALMGHTFSLDVRQRISRTLMGKMAGELNPFYGKHHTIENKQKSRLRAINMIASGLLSSRRTEIEVKIAQELKNRDLKFIEQYPIADVTVVDFYLPKDKVVIYCDGDYWHRGEWARKNKVIGKDIAQNRYLRNAGYKVFRFSESEINSSPSNCVDKVNEYLNLLYPTIP